MSKRKEREPKVYKVIHEHPEMTDEEREEARERAERNYFYILSVKRDRLYREAMAAAAAEAAEAAE